MPAFEIVCFLKREYGISSAVRMGFLGDLLITSLRTGEQYTSLEDCVAAEGPELTDEG